MAAKDRRYARKKAQSARGDRRAGCKAWPGVGGIHSLGESRAGSSRKREGRVGWQGWRVDGLRAN